MHYVKIAAITGAVFFAPVAASAAELTFKYSTDGVGSVSLTFKL